jgi:DNA-binding ferritin-like protein
MDAKAAAAQTKAAAAGKAKGKNLDVAQLETAVKQGLLSLAEFITRMEQIGMSATDAALLGAELQGQMDSAATKEKAAAAAKAAAAVKHVDVSQEERAVRLGAQTIQQYAAFLDSHGFDPHDRDVLVSELQAQLVTDQQTAAKKQAAAAKLAQKGIALPQLERLVRAGVKTPADYSAALQSAGYDAADQAAMTDFLKLQMQQDQQDLIVHGRAADLVGQMGPSLTDLGRAVKLGVIPIAAYQDALKRAGLASADQQTLVKTLAAQIKATRGQQSTAQTVSKQVAAAGVSLATLEKDTLSGKLSIEQFGGLLAGYGVPEAQVTDVVALVQDEMDNAQAVQALVNQAGARAAAKGLNLGEDTAAYKQGVMSEDEWRSRVASLGYDAADVEMLFETLAAQQAATAAKSAKKTTAPAATAATAG